MNKCFFSNDALTSAYYSTEYRWMDKGDKRDVCGTTGRGGREMVEGQDMGAGFLEKARNKGWIGTFDIGS